MRSQISRIALITGANKGIGLEIARQLGKADHRVLIGARDASLGEAAASALKSEGIDVCFIPSTSASREQFRAPQPPSKLTTEGLMCW